MRQGLELHVIAADRQAGNTACRLFASIRGEPGRGDLFNRDGRRMRAVFVKSVSDGTDEYRLWRGTGKPDRDYASAENDKYYLYAEVNGYTKCMVRE